MRDETIYGSLPDHDDNESLIKEADTLTSLALRLVFNDFKEEPLDADILALSDSNKSAWIERLDRVFQGLQSQEQSRTRPTRLARPTFSFKGSLSELQKHYQIDLSDKVGVIRPHPNPSVDKFPEFAHGLFAKTYVKYVSPPIGKGLFAARIIKKDELITEMMKPRFITEDEENELEKKMTGMLGMRDDFEENRDFRIMLGTKRIFDDTWTILGKEPSFAMRFLLCGTPVGDIKELKKPRWYLMNNAIESGQENVAVRIKHTPEKIKCLFIAKNEIQPDEELRWKYDSS